MRYEFGAIIESNGETFGVFFPDLPGCITVGDSIDQAKVRAVEALTLHLEGMLEDGEAIPQPAPLDQLPADPEVSEVERVMVMVDLPGAGAGRAPNLRVVDGAKAELSGAEDDPDELSQDELDEIALRESYGYRHFLYEADGTLMRVPIRVADGLSCGLDRLPQYANQRLRGLHVRLWLEGGHAQLVDDVHAFIWPFDEAGSVQFNLAKAAMIAWETSDVLKRELRAKPGPIADIKPQIARRRWEEENRWEPTKDELKRVMAIIFPETADGPVERIKSVIGTRKRRIPMSFEAEGALKECSAAASDILWKITRLRDKDLKAFIQGAEERFDPAEPMRTTFWKGVISAVEKEIEVRAARKSAKGKWFAALEVYREDTGRHGVGSITTFEFLECNGRPAAIKAVREMLAKHAGLFGVGVSIEGRLYPEIEWPGPS